MHRTILLVSGALALGGCSSVRIDLEYAPEPQQVASLAGESFSLAVTDLRPYVTHGRKSAKYLGHTKGVLGVVHSYSPSDQVALREHVRTDLVKDLQSLGMVEDRQAPALRLAVRIRDWNFDAGVRGRFWYEAQVVIDRAGSPSAQTIVVKGDAPLSGAWGDPARLFVENEIPALYVGFLKNLVRDNPEVIAALSHETPAERQESAVLLPGPGP